MNILIVNCVYDPEPIVSAQIGKSLAETLAQNKFNVSVIAPFPSRPKGFLFDKKYDLQNKIVITKSKPNLMVYRLPSFIYSGTSFLGRLRETISFGLVCYKYIKNNAEKIDVVYMNTWPLFGQFGVAKACKEKQIPYTVHVQDLYPESLVNKLPKLLGSLITQILLPIDRYNLKFSRKIIAISENMKIQLMQTRSLNDEKIDIVYNWQDKSKFVESDLAPNVNSKFTFTYLGNIGPVAGIQILIKAFQIANQTQLRLIIAGNGSEKERCVELASKTPDLDINFIIVPDGSVGEIQNFADVLLLPIIKGGGFSSIPSKLPGYMLSAKPIIATIDKGSDTANAIIEAKCGWVGKSENVEWLAKTMVEVSKLDSEYLNELGKNGYNYCLKRFSKELNLKKIINIILNEQ